jgi:transcriptional regulator with XRE-family HTH domain
VVGGSDPNPLGALLRAHRQRAGYDAATLARIAGVSEAVISLCEESRRNLGAASASKIATALELSEPEVNAFLVAREETKRALAKAAAHDPELEARLEYLELAVTVLLRQAMIGGVDLPPELDPPIIWRGSSHPEAHH